MASNHTSMLPFELAPETPATWTLVQESFLINQMVETVTARGDHRSSGVFSKDEWLTIRKAYYERFQMNHSKKSFKNKMNNSKDRFKDFKKLVEKNTGLGWDYVLCTVDATPIWWDEYLKENPRMKRFRIHGCPEYKKLEIIFGDTIATGHIQASQGHNFDSSDDEIETVPTTQFPSMDVPQEHEQIHPPKRNAQSKRRKSSDLSDAMMMMAEASQTRNELRKKHSIEECMKVLDEMEDNMSNDIYMRAVKLLQEKGWRESFMLMSDARRSGWIESIRSGIL